MRKQGPISIVPFRIYNRDAFLEQNHPVIDPKDQAYDDYWFEVTNKVVYGMWKPDHPKGQPKKYRWIPGNLYFYINLTEIELQGDGNTAVYGPPSLRDIDWLKAYGCNACEGFSGFDGDEEITCNRLVDKYERGAKLRHDEELFLKADKTVLRPDGKYKKYVEAREYMYRTFDKPMGKPMWHNTALNFIELTSRGVGKSYWLANGEIAHDYVTNGCKKIEDILEGKISTTIVVGSSQEKYTNDLLGKFNHTYEYLRIGPGYFNDGIDETFGFFYQPSEGSLNGKKPFTNRVLQQGGGGYLGAGSKIYNVTYYKNNQAGVGKRARKFITDESGTLDNFKAVHGENSAAQNRETKFGLSMYSGTGGNMDKIEGIKDAFSNPRGYEILPYEDLFGYNNKETGLFIPCYYRRDIYRDPDGNIDLEKAYEDELAIRIEKGKESTEAYDAHIVSYPFYPHEMFMQVKQNAFPTILLEDRLAELEGGLWEKIAKVGKLEYVDNTKTRVRFDFDHLGKLKPIIHFKEEENRKNNKHGAVVIYEHPTPDKPEPSQMDPLYITVYDPVRDDKGSSLCVVLVFKFWYPQDISKVQFNVVAEWIGRMDTLDENHEMAWKLASYYGCKMCPEINNADILRNARDTGRWQMLQKKPKKIMGEFQQLKDYEVGVYISPGMKPSLGLYLNEIFETVVDKQVEFLEDGTMKETIIKMASQIPSIRLIEEALNYGEGNFDMISAMFIVALVQRNNTLTIGTKETEKDEEVIQKYKEFVKKRNNFLNKKPVWAK